MIKYIAMLRGINVSGQKLIKMVDLRLSMEKLGLENVSTYVQSGNILFETDDSDQNIIAKKIESQIKKDFTFEVPCLVKTAAHFEVVLNNNPFLEEGKPSDRCYVTFLEKTPDPQLVDQIDPSKYEPEAFEIRDTTLYFYSPDGYGRAKMNNNFFENKLKVKATTRNWKTVNKLFELATT